jgi:hypothetical protein
MARSESERYDLAEAAKREGEVVPTGLDAGMCSDSETSPTFTRPRLDNSSQLRVVPNMSDPIAALRGMHKYWAAPATREFQI